jgi:hypothetical protein
MNAYAAHEMLKSLLEREEPTQLGFLTGNAAIAQAIAITSIAELFPPLLATLEAMAASLLELQQLAAELREDYRREQLRGGKGGIP